MKIKKITARKILNSAGKWTIESTLELENDEKVSASVPQGVSTGKGEKATVGVETAINQIEKEINPQIREKDLDQESLDQILEQGNWGSNATLAISAAFFKANNKTIKTKGLPQMMILIFEGEKHGNPNLTIQEFMIITSSLQQGIDFFNKTAEYIKRIGEIDTVGSEGGFSPKSFNDQKILEIMKQLGASKIALDIAGNVNPPSINSLLDIVRRYPIISLEDPFPEDRPNQWKEFYPKVKAINPQIMIVADDLTVTDAEKIKKGANKLFNAVIIKPNQQGTITAASKAVEMAKRLAIKTIVSHRGEETNDTWISDFAVAFQADFVKFGGPSKGERVAKYNRLLELTGN